MTRGARYDPEPDYPAVGGEVERGLPEVTIETNAGVTHRLAYAETIVVPAAVGGYRLRGRGRAVKAFLV